MSNSRKHNLLIEYLRGELSSKERKRLEQELRSSESLRDQLEQTRRYLTHLRELRSEKAPPDFLQKVNQRIDRPGIFTRMFLPMHTKLPLELGGLVAATLIVIVVIKPFEKAGTIFHESIPQESVLSEPPAGIRSQSPGMADRSLGSDQVEAVEESQAQGATIESTRKQSLANSQKSRTTLGSARKSSGPSSDLRAEKTKQVEALAFDAPEGTRESEHEDRSSGMRPLSRSEKKKASQNRTESSGSNAFGMSKLSARSSFAPPVPEETAEIAAETSDRPIDSEAVAKRDTVSLVFVLAERNQAFVRSRTNAQKLEQSDSAIDSDGLSEAQSSAPLDPASLIRELAKKHEGSVTQISSPDQTYSIQLDADNFDTFVENLSAMGAVEIATFPPKHPSRQIIVEITVSPSAPGGAR